MYSYYREKFTVDHLSINGLLRRNFEQQDNEIISLIFFFFCTTDPFYYVNKGLFQCNNIIAV